MGEAGPMTTDLFIAFIRVTMLAGAVYDAAFAVPILVAPERLAPLLGLAMPAQEIYLRFTSVFLLGFALFYLLPAAYPGRYLGNVAAAVAIRALGGIFMVVAVAAYDQPRPFLILGVIDLAFAAVHYVSLVPFAGPRIWRLAGADLAPRPPADRSD